MSVLSSHWLECDVEGTMMTLVFLSSPLNILPVTLLCICSAGHTAGRGVI